MNNRSNVEKFGVVGRLLHLNHFIHIHESLTNQSFYETRLCIKQIIRNQQYFFAQILYNNRSFSEFTDYELRSWHFCTHPKLVAFLNNWLEVHELGKVANRYTDRKRKAILAKILAEIIGEVYNVFPDFIGSQKALQELNNPEQELLNACGESILIPDDFWMQDWIEASSTPMTQPSLPTLNLDEADFE